MVELDNEELTLLFPFRTVQQLVAHDDHGEEGYTYPPFDEHGRPWTFENGSIRLDAPVFEHPTGRATMRVQRTKWGVKAEIPPEQLPRVRAAVRAIKKFRPRNRDTAAPADLEPGGDVPQNAGALDGAVPVSEPAS